MPDLTNWRQFTGQLIHGANHFSISAARQAVINSILLWVIHLETHTVFQSMQAMKWTFGRSSKIKVRVPGLIHFLHGKI